MAEPYDLIGRVLAHYPQSVTGVQAIQVGGPKAVWKLETPGEPLCLKQLRHPSERAAFSVTAQAHVARAGGPVPPVLPARDGSLWTEVDGKVYVLYGWMEGRSARVKDRRDLIPAVQALAAFHEASRGYRPPQDCRVSSKLGSWPDRYRSIRERLEAWKEVAAARPQEPFHAAYLSVIDDELALAREAEEALRRSRYAAMVEAALPGDTLCHQDFGDGNALVAGDRVWIVDLDNVTFDFPARDLRKLLNTLMLDTGGWSGSLARTVLDAYTQTRRLSEGDLELLAIDLLFPHPFHDAAKNWFKKGKREKASRLREVLPLERQKRAALHEGPLQGRWV